MCTEWDIFGSFSKLSPNGILWGFTYLGHIDDTKSVEFASVAICSTFFHKMTILIASLTHTHTHTHTHTEPSHQINRTQPPVKTIAKKLFNVFASVISKN